jgi:hypothetical protein
VEVDLPDVVAEVREAFARYEAALIGNDAATLTAFLWPDPRVVRYGLADVQHGFAEIAAFRAAEALASPPRRLERTTVTCFGRDMATVCTLFHRDDAPGRLGRQTQVWARLDGWRVVSAHVSLIELAAG